MRISAPLRLSIPLVLLCACAALLAAGCGGGSAGTGAGTTAPAGESGGGAAESGGAGGGTSKKATAPNAPAGSKVVACEEGREGAVQLRATAVDCATARATMQKWESSHACTLGKDASRSSCSIGAFRCQAVRVDRGAAVSCARPDGDVSFIVKSWLLKGGGG